MKITSNTSGFLSEISYNESLKFFLQQYDGRFPGIEYLHLELKEANKAQVENNLNQPIYYSSNGTMLKIEVAIQTSSRKPTPYEVLSKLRNIFDAGVEEHLKNHQHELRYAPELYK